MKQLFTLLFASALLFGGLTQQANAQCTGVIGLAPPAAWLPRVVPAAPAWGTNNPPTSSGTALAPPCNAAGYGVNCNVCPSTFSLNLPTTNRVLMYLCAGNLYTITTCSTPAAYDSHITITNAAGSVVYAYDDDGCGVPNGHSTVTFSPPTSGAYGIRVTGPGCAAPPSPALLQIQCSAGACPGPGDDPCAVTPPAPCNPNFPTCAPTPGAANFGPLSSTCTTLNGSTAGATGTSGVGTPSCGVYPNSGDVWFSASASATGTLAIDVDNFSATNLAMAIYSPSAGCPNPGLTQVPGLCNADLIPGLDNSPFISTSSLTPGALYYIRVWPEANAANGGTFTICAYHPVPPVNDQPCGALPLSMANPTCVTASFDTQDATPLSGVTLSAGSPTCTGGIAGNDIWFRITVPAPGGRVNVNTLAGSLNNMAMAIYTGPCAGPLNQVECSGVLGMPNIATAAVYPAGTVLYVRMWSQTTGFGNFQICAFLSQPPPNDNPCGAIPISAQFGCLMTGITTAEATQTPTTLNGPGSIPNPPCGGVPNNDVWFTTVVPPNGQIVMDMDDAQMNDAAYAVYSAPNCSGAFTIAGAPNCRVSGSTNTGASGMPAGVTGGLTPGSTVYIRVWRQSGNAGTAFLCVNRSDTPPVNPGVSCYFTLRMLDSGGDGWNGSFVTVTVGGVPTNYTINSGSGTISFPVNQGQAYTISYTAVGGFQNQISYSIVTNQLGLVYSSPAGAPGTGLVAAGNADCNLPPADPADCAGAFRICDATTGLGGSPTNIGAVTDLSSANDGCLAGEHQGLWYTFSASAAGTLAFTLTPTSAAYTDYDFALWGPYTAQPLCPLGPTGPPVRCSFAAGGAATGLNMSSVDLTEGAGGDSWVRFLNMNVGDYYILFLDNWSRNGISFNFGFSGTADLGCVILPVELLKFDGQAVSRTVELDWSTSAERNSSHFFVDRSQDGVNFEPIGRVEAMGNVLSRTDYKFVDPAPYEGVNYYRLRQIEQGGGVGVTQVITVLFRQGGVPLFVFPNPATETLQASFGSTEEGTVRWRILDTSGRQVGEGSAGSTEGINQFSVPVNALDAGSYILEVLNDKGAPIGNARFVRQ